NTASVSVSGGTELNTANNTDDDLTTISQPDLTITKSHVGNFTQGQTGAQYTITVTNSGSTSTTGTVTVTDTLPTGLTATAISGTGWTCTLATLVCTRTDVLTAGNSYPTIALTVTVAGNAPASVTNSATVSCTAAGCETSGATGNNTATDPTTVNSGAATKLVITGTGTQTAGTGQNLTITARDASNTTVTSYAGDKILTFSGANSSTNPVTAPTVKDKTGSPIAFGTPTTITFTNGVATVSAGNNGVMTLYKAETATIAVTDGTISATGADRLTVVVSAAALDKFALSLTSPQTNSVAFTGTNTLTAQDAFGNTVTTFNASTNNVTITANAPLTGLVSGLGSGGNNVLNQAGDFSSGVANLTMLGMKYTGDTGTGTFTATSASGKTGTSGNVTVNAGALHHFLVEAGGGGPIGTQAAGTAFNVMITAQD